MQTMTVSAIESWVLDHAAAGGNKFFFTINGDVPLTNRDGQSIYYEIPTQGKRVCVLHPEHLTQVALICYESGVQMVQVQV
jgi:hypothetical protein